MKLRRILTSTTVGELTLKTQPTLGPTDTVADATAEMRKASHGSAVVCSEDRLVGIFTERDLLPVLLASGGIETPLSEVMTVDPQTVTVADSLLEAVRLMDQGGYRRLPVVNETGNPVGFIDTKTIVHFLVEHFPSAVYNQASHAQLIARYREGA